jgi:hypothetical protein
MSELTAAMPEALVRSPRVRWRASLWAILPPVAVFAASWLQLFLNAKAHGRPFKPELFIHYDAFLYQSIAQKGYDFYPCPGYHITNDFRGPGYCGNAGWLPLYPWLLRLVHLGVSNWALCAVLVSGAASLCCLLILWNDFLKQTPGWRPLVLLVFAGFFPGQTWYASGYPISTVLALILLAFAFLNHRRYLLGGAAGGLAAITYSTGFLLFFVFGLWLLITERGKSWVRQVRLQLEVPGLVAVGFASFLVMHAVRLHAWNAFFKVQAKYGHGLHNPLVTFALKTQPLWKGQFWLDYGRFPAQTVFVAMLVIGVCVTLWRQRREGISAMDLLALIYTLTFWFVPLVIGQGVTIYRAESLLMPMTLLLRRWGLWVQIGCVVIALILSIQFPESFFVNFMP